MLDGCYFDLLLHFEPLISLRSDILNEAALILEELLEAPPLMWLILLARVDVWGELAALEFLHFLRLPHGSQLGLLPIEEVLHLSMKGAVPSAVGGPLRVHVVVHHRL